MRTSSTTTQPTGQTGANTLEELLIDHRRLQDERHNGHNAEIVASDTTAAAAAAIAAAITRSHNEPLPHVRCTLAASK